jgi:hypothetical protein
MLNSDKHSNLMDQFLSYKDNKVLWICPLDLMCLSPPSKHFQLSLMFVGKAKCLPLSGAPPNFRPGWRSLPKTNTSLLRKFLNHGQCRYGSVFRELLKNYFFQNKIITTFLTFLSWIFCQKKMIFNYLRTFCKHTILLLIVHPEARTIMAFGI